MLYPKIFRCEIPNPTPNIVGLGTRMMQEPFWLGLFAVFVVLGFIGLIWCGKRHFPEKIEKLLAEEADRCARREFAYIFFITILEDKSLG